MDELTGGAATVQVNRHGKNPVFPRVDSIAVAVDGSPGSAAAIMWAASLATAWKAKVTVISVAPPWLGPEAWAGPLSDSQLVESLYNEYEEEAEKVADAAVARLRAMDVKAEKLVDRGSPAQRIVAATKRLKSGLVILGSHGHGLADKLRLGSVANRVKHEAPCSVLLVRSPPKVGPVLASVDGSWTSLVAAEAARQIGKAWGAKNLYLHCLHLPVFGTGNAARQVAQEARPILEAFSDSSGSLYHRVSLGSPAPVILEFAKENQCALIVMGSRGLGAVRGFVLGSVSNRVSHESPITVLLVKDPAA